MVYLSLVLFSQVITILIKFFIVFKELNFLWFQGFYAIFMFILCGFLCKFQDFNVIFKVFV